MGREVRRVPPDWQHPKDSNGHYIPLYGECYSEALAKWDHGKEMWDAGFMDDWKGGWKPKGDEDCQFEEWHGKRPTPDAYFPDWPPESRTHYQMYQTTSEGTPISPVMATPEELAQWLVDHNASAFAGMTADYEHWLRVARGGFACSAVLTGGKMMSGVEGLS